MIQLVRPNLDFAGQIMDFRRELLEADDDSAFAGCSWLEDYEDVSSWLAFLERERNPQTSRGVSSDTWLAVRTEDNRLVGMIDLRHHIDHPILGVWGGHMGYTVRPSERRKGYATRMLRLNLDKCRERGMEKVLLTCDEHNFASERTILANGGVYEQTICVDGDRIKRYWITL